MLPGRKETVGVTPKNNRLFVNAVIWIAKTGAPWRDVPERFGKWNSFYQWFRRWTKKGRWKVIFKELSMDADLEALMEDSTLIRAHLHAAGVLKKGGQEQKGLGRSCGGFFSQVDALIGCFI